MYLLHREKREKDNALLRNAHMSQNMEMSQCNVRYQETEIIELRNKISELDNLIAQHKEVSKQMLDFNFWTDRLQSIMS